MKAKLRIMLLCGKTERLGFSWILLWSAGKLRMAWAGLGRLAGDRTLRKIVSKAQKKVLCTGHSTCGYDPEQALFKVIPVPTAVNDEMQ